MTTMDSTAQSAPSTAPTRRPASVWATFSLLVFLGLSGLFGGIGLIFGIWGLELIPRAPLDRIPVIDSWLIPGLVLAVGFGLGSLAAAYGILARPSRPHLAALRNLTGLHWSWTATAVLGLGQIAWLAVEWVYVGMSPLLVIYGAIAVTLVITPLLELARRSPRLTSGEPL